MKDREGADDKSNGRTRGKSARAFWSLLVLAAVGYGAFNFVSADDSDTKMMDRATGAMPDDEKAFAKVAADYGGSKFIYANALQLVPMREDRAKAFCATVNEGAVKGWVGRVDGISATTRGDAILKLYIYGTGTVMVENWNEKTNANEDKFPVPRGTPLFATIAALKDLDLVRFDGELQPSGSDCFRTDGTASADQDGNLAPTMMSPTFMLRFSDMRKLD